MKLPSDEPMSKSAAYLVYLIFWIFCLIAHIYLIHNYGMNWRVSFTDGLFSVSTMALSAFITTVFYKHFHGGKEQLITRIVWALGLAAACTAAQFYFLTFVFAGRPDYLFLLSLSLPVRVLISFQVIAFVMLITWILSSLKEKNNNRSIKEHEENLLKEAELARLRQQLQPHFLFNSLNSVNALVTADPPQARKMVQALSDYMRMNLRKDDRLIPFSEELQHTALYLEIEKVRFGHRLKITMNSESDCDNFPVPPLILQPIVENAIKFGLYNVTGEVEIGICAKRENNLLLVQTTNPFDKETVSAARGTGFGLNSVQRRLFLLFGRNDLIQTDSRENLFVTSIRIPEKKQSL
jgi:hypothetical protein